MGTPSISGTVCEMRWSADSELLAIVLAPNQDDKESRCTLQVKPTLSIRQ